MMKKSYTKPQLIYESFKISSSVAACFVDKTATDKAKCSFQLDPDDPMFVLYNRSYTGSPCNTDGEDECSFGGPGEVDGATIFNS